MKKKFLSVMLGLTAAFVIGNSQAAINSVYADEIPEMNLTNDELFERYAIETLGLNGDEVSADRLEYAGSYLQGLSKSVYDILKPQIKKIADGELDNSTVSIYATRIDGFKSEFTKEELGVEAIVSSGSLTPAAKEAFEAKIKEQFDSIDNVVIDHALLWDCPYEMYWYMKTEGSSMGTTPYSYEFNSESVSLIDRDNILIDFSFSVDPTYRSDASDKYSVNTSKTGAAKTAAATAKTIVDNAKSLSDYDKLVAYKDAICDLTVYNYDAAASSPAKLGTIAPWQIIYVFDNDPTTNVVCEGYSKSFAYLCELTDFDDDDIKVFLVSGNMGEAPNAKGAHMWNVAHMGDGYNYLVDITNCDEDTVGAPDKLFLRGASETITDSAKNIKGYKFDIADQNPQYYMYDNETFDSFGWDELELSDTDYDPTGNVIKKPVIAAFDCGSITLKEYEGYEYSLDDKTWQKSSKFSDLTAGEDYTFYQRIAAAGENPASASKSYTVNFDAPPHEFESEFTIDKAPTCTEDGSKSIHCSVCGGLADVTVIPALGHDWDDGVITKARTYAENGIRVVTCKNDGNHKKEISLPSFQISGEIIDEDIENFKEEEMKGNAVKVIGIADAAQYTGSAITFDVRVYKGNKLLKEVKDYTIKYSNNKVVSDAKSPLAPTVTITGKGANSDINETKTFSILPISFENNDKVCVSNVTSYLSNVGNPVPDLTFDGKKLKVNVDYEVAGAENYNKAGTYDIKVSGKGNYTGAVISKFTVVDDSKGYILMSKAKINGYAKSLKYNPNGATIQDLSRIVVKVGTETLTPTDYEVSYANNATPGTASMIVKAAAGSTKFAGEKIVTFKVVGTPISKTKPVFDKTYSYTGEAIKALKKIELSDGTELKEGKDYTFSYAKNVNAGTASIIITGKGAYTGTVKKTFKIKPVDLSKDTNIKVTPVKSSIKQDGDYTIYDVEVRNGEKPMYKDIDYTVSYKKTKDSTVLTAVIKGKGNYAKTINFNGPLN